MTPRRTLPLLALLLCLLAPRAAGQDRFVVMSVAGKVTCSVDRGKTWKIVAPGLALGPAALVRTSYASYVKLLVNGSRLAGVDANATRKLSSLKAKTPAGAVAGEPLRLLGDAMQRARQYRPGSVAGGVRLIRSGALCTAAFPRYDVLSATPRFRWVDESGGSVYTLVVRDSAFSVVARRSVRGSAIDSACTLARGCTYYWQVERADTALASNIAMFTVLAEDSVEELRRELVRLDGELRAMKADEVLRHLAHALYFERKGLFMDAAQEYRDAIALRPSTEEYRNLLRQLLQSINLYAEAEILLQ